MQCECDRKKAALPRLHPLYSVLVVWLVVIFAVADAWAAEIVDRIVAVVNDDIITLNDLNHSLGPFLERLRSSGYDSEKQSEMVAKLQDEVLSRLIDEKLTDQEIKKAGIEVGDAEVNEAIERVKQQNYYSDEDFAKALAAEGLTVAEYRKNLKEQILRSRLVNREVKSRAVVTEEDIKDYYESHSSDYGGETRYHLRHIIMRLPAGAGAAEQQAVLKKMEAVREKLENGESFPELAKQYSESELAPDGGDLGEFNVAALSPQLQQALKGLQKGDFTAILATDHGYQIFYVQSIVMIPGKSLAEVSASIQGKLYAEIVEKKFKQWLEELRKRSHVKLIPD